MNDMHPMEPEKRRCKARSRSGNQCARAPIRGGFVCVMHGGKAPQVKAKAEQRLQDLIDPDRALREAARLAYSDVRELFNEKGSLRPVKEWPDHLAAAVGSLEVVKRNVDSSDGRTDDVIKLRLWDKPKNIDLLFRHLGLIKERVDVNIDLGALAERLMVGRRRLGNGQSG